MKTSLTHLIHHPARHKLAHPPSREKLTPLRHKKPICSPRSPLFFIGGRNSPPNAPFFPPIPPLRNRFRDPIARARKARAENLHPHAARCHAASPSTFSEFSVSNNSQILQPQRPAICSTLEVDARTGAAKKVTIHLNEDTSSQHDFLYKEIVAFLYAQGVAGATVIRPEAGFGSHRRIHTAGAGSVAGEHLPIRIEFLESSEVVDVILPALCELVSDGVIETQAIKIVKAARRAGPA